MRQLVIVSFTIAALLTTVGASVRAQTPAPAAQMPSPATPAQPPDAAAEEWSTTQHSMRLGGQTIPYAASAGTTLLKNDAGDPIGLMYSASYVRSDVTDKSTRPVSFLFNGGPGRRRCGCTWDRSGPSAWSRPTATTRRRRRTRLSTTRKRCSHRTDLVFIDAMGTGFSRIAGRGTETRLLRRRRGRGRVCAVHHDVAQPQRPLELAEVHHRRKLRHLPRRGRGQHAAAARRPSQRRQPAVDGARPVDDHVCAPATTGPTSTTCPAMPPWRGITRR